MGKIWIIIRREYITRVRKKSFLVTTLLAPLGFIALMLSSVLLSTYSSSVKHVAIVDDSGLFKDAVFADAPDGSIIFHKENNANGIERGLAAEHPKYDALVAIPATFDIENPRRVSIRYMSAKGVGIMAQSFVNKTFSEQIQHLRAAQWHIDKAQLEDLNQEVKLDFLRVSDTRQNDAGAEAGAVLGYVLGFAIYITLIIYGTMIMKGVVEEKSNRIMEVLVSSVKPLQLMMAKIIGIGAVGLTQFFLWGVMIMLTNFLLLPVLGITMPHTSNISAGQLQGSNVDPDEIASLIRGLSAIHWKPVIAVFIIYFLGGFFLYGSLFAAVGAAAGDETDSQSLTLPIMMPIIISIIILMNTLSQPEGNLTFWASLIPFSSPIIMPALMPFSPPWWQVTLSVALLIGGFVFCSWVAAKVYRTGILMYGKKTTFMEIARWIFSK
ncbi:MAG: ABC transporter permease [Chitinophagales bacterium]